MGPGTDNGEGRSQREYLGAGKPTKKWPEMTDEEKHAFAEGIVAQMKRAKNANEREEGTTP